MHQRKTRTVVVGAAAMAVAMVGTALLAGVVAAQSSSDDAMSACVKASNGSVRNLTLNGTTNCNGSEDVYTWAVGAGDVPPPAADPVLTRVTNTLAITADDLGVLGVEAACPAGKAVLSGGVQTNSNSQMRVVVTGSYPLGNDIWRAEVSVLSANSASESTSVEVFAICA